MVTHGTTFQTQRDKIWAFVRLLLIPLFFIPVQTFLLEGIKIGGIKPDMGFLLAYILGLTSGYQKGLLGGMLFGGLQDFFALGTLGPSCVINGIIGGGIGLLERFFLYVSLRTHIFIIFLASLLHNLMGAIGAHGVFEGLYALSWRMAGQAVYNCIFAIGIFLLYWPHALEEGPWMGRKENNALFPS